MYWTNLKIAWRNLVINKTFSFLNISGLAVGMAVAMLIGLWVWDEVSFDKAIPGHEKIAKVMHTTENNGQIETASYTNYPLSEVLRNEYGDRFKYVVLSSGTWDHVFDVDGKRITKTGTFMEPDAPKMLGLEILEGSINALADPGSVMISSSLAKQLFGDTEALGKLAKMDREHTMKVGAVYKDLQQNSSFSDLQFLGAWKFYFSISPWIRDHPDPWRPNAFTTYVQLSDKAGLEQSSAAIKDVRLKHVSERLARLKPKLHLHPMDKWHLYDEFRNGVNTGGRIRYVWFFSVIGIFVLVLACINFMNLSTARSEKRAKEVGIRKTIGSLRRQLIMQFFAESMLYTFIAFGVALIIVQMTIPLFNKLSEKEIMVPWLSPVFWTTGLLFCLFTGLVAGMYPALYLSSFRPVKVLKGTFKQGRFAAIPRKVLVVVQFSVSIILIIGTIVVFQQINHARNRPVGYNREGLLEVFLPTEAMHVHFDAVKNELLSKNIITGLTEADASNTEINSTSTGFEWEGKDPNTGVNFPTSYVSYDYGKTVGWKFLEGRDFDPAHKADSTGIILNEAAAIFMGLRDRAPGKTITWDGDVLNVVGVIQDVITESPYNDVRPAVYLLTSDRIGVLVARLHPQVSVPVALKSFETLYKKYYPDFEFNYRFTDESYNQKFGNEERIGTLAGFFAGLAIFISCLGLFGMASFVAQQRAKEIGVRKVLGASVFGVWKLLSVDFIRLVVISLLIAIPIAWYFMHDWLQNFPHHTRISAFVFLLAGGLAVLITLFTVSYQSIRAALTNPVKNLKSE